MAQAESELQAAFCNNEMRVDIVMGILRRAVAGERLMMGQHPDCGADNPEGVAAKCACYCHKGHYRHMWQPIIKTPVLNPDGTYHLLDRCKFCPDLRMKVIKTAWVNEKHTLVSLEYLIRGEQRVLTKEEWIEKAPQPHGLEKLREVEL